MRSLLVRCYPARWRDRYGEEFQVILEERPLGPFDVADILLGALDARLRQGRGADLTPERRISMSLRVGGIAAVVGAPLWTIGFLIGNDLFLAGNTQAAAILVVAGSLALLVALAALSAFQARVQPVLSWAAFALPAIGTLGLVFGAASPQCSDETNSRMPSTSGCWRSSLARCCLRSPRSSRRSSRGSEPSCSVRRHCWRSPRAAVRTRGRSWMSRP